MAYTLSSNALITSSDLQLWTGKDPETIDATLKAKIEFCAEASSEAIQDYCGRTFNTTIATDEVYDGQESDVITLRNYPVQSVGALVFWDDSTVDVDSYYIDYNAGAIYLKNGTQTPRGRGLVKVTYTHGYATIPYAVKQACLIQYEYLYKNFGQPMMLGIKSRAKMNESESKDNNIGESGLVAEAIGLVSRYKRCEAPLSPIMFARVT